MRRTVFIILALLSTNAVLTPTARAQSPELFVNDVTLGPHHIETRYVLASGKWSEAGPNVGANSAYIHCYEKVGICEVADAYMLAGQAFSNLTTYDILRWDGMELIAVDSSPVCVVNTIRIDFREKKVSLSSASKGAQDKLCEKFQPSPTTFLMGLKDVLDQISKGSKQ